VAEIQGLNARTLAHCRLIHLHYPLNLQTVSAKFEKSLIFGHSTISPEPSRESKRPDFSTPVEELFQNLSFSHFVEFLRISDPLRREIGPSRP
jgi:hypothetical protein